MSSSPKSSLQTNELQPFIDSSLSDSNSILVSNNLSCNISKTASCGHLLEIRSKLGSNPFSNLKDYLKLRPLGRASIRRDPVLDVAQCGACGRPRSRLYACLACATVSCHLHASSHAADATDDGGCSPHSIAVDIDRAELFCCVCKDQVYDCDFDVAVVVAQSAVSTIVPIPDPLSESMPKRRRVEYKPWTPDLKEQALIAENSRPLMSQPGLFSELDLEIPRGLRGLNNLGNTCFMNSVLQALLHTAPLRNFFLSDKHNRFFCKQKNDVNHAHSNKDVARICLACDLDAMFSAVFSGDQKPYSPAKFLYSWWQHASNLASYEQQDAHEFFISMLDGIHEKMVKDKHKPHRQGSGDCCIAHRVFSGILRSDVMCTACGFTSTTFDPCLDISLDLEPNIGVSSKLASTKSVLPFNGEATSSCEKSGVSTLTGCLDRFTRPERLGSEQKFYCQQCKVRQESLKQMSIRKLPLVSCFHMKRFEHSHIKKMSRKIDQYVQFPFSLNMAPYLSSSILRSRFGNRYFPFDETDNQSDDSNEPSSEFELFAVITHTGKLDSGHYVTYLRLGNQWYKCDDAWVTQVNDSIVRAAQGYMMFYVQKMLYYKASERQVTT